MDMDDEDYGLEYSDDSGSEPDVALENQYYAAKSLKSDGDFESALETFRTVVDLETDKGEKGDWGFKSLKQMTKLTFHLNRFDEMLRNYTKLLTYIKSAVTKNYAEKSINSILDYVSTSQKADLLQKFYQITLDALKDAKNERLWFKTNIKLGKLYFDQNLYDKLERVLRQLRNSCKTEDGEEDQKKGTQLLEIYALEIQMYTEQKNNKALTRLYEQAAHIKSAIPHPLIMGTVRECGGKMHLRNGEFSKAHTDFFEAFKNYDESGSPRRIVCLKYVVLANMLMKSDINPFDSQETKSFRNEPEIVVMTQLVAAYQDNNIELFDKIIEDNRESVMSDPFIREHIEELLSNIRTQVLVGLVKPYQRVRLQYLAEQLNVSVDEVNRLLVELIQERRTPLKIDHVNGVLCNVPDKYAFIAEQRFKAISNMCKQLERLEKSLKEKPRFDGYDIANPNPATPTEGRPAKRIFTEEDRIFSMSSGTSPVWAKIKDPNLKIQVDMKPDTLSSPATSNPPTPATSSSRKHSIGRPRAVELKDEPVMDEDEEEPDEKPKNKSGRKPKKRRTGPAV